MPQNKVLRHDAFVGVDVAKSELVLHLHPDGTGWRVSNDKAGLAALAKRLRALAAGRTLRVGFEASGGYERKLAALLDKLDIAAWLLDPARVRSFARAERSLAKTDPLDAALIARTLAALHEQIEPYRYDPQAQQLADHVRLRDLAVAQAVQWRQQLESIADPAMRRMILAQIARAKTSMLRIEQAIARLIAASPQIAMREALLRSAPGVGPVVAACLLARLPELGQISSRQIASLAGLAPFDRQSGTSARPARCQGGRPAVRRVLYLAALSVMRQAKSPIAAIGLKLKAAARPAKVAIIAVARKLLVTLNAMVKANTPYSQA